MKCLLQAVAPKLCRYLVLGWLAPTGGATQSTGSLDLQGHLPLLVLGLLRGHYRCHHLVGLHLRTLCCLPFLVTCWSQRTLRWSARVEHKHQKAIAFEKNQRQVQGKSMVIKRVRQLAHQDMVRANSARSQAAQACIFHSPSSHKENTP